MIASSRQPAELPDGSVTSNFFTSGVTIDPNNGNNFLSVTTNYDSPQIDLSLTLRTRPIPSFRREHHLHDSGDERRSRHRHGRELQCIQQRHAAVQAATAPPGWNCTLPAVGGNPTFTCTNPSFAPSTVNFTVVLKAEQDILGVNDGTVSVAFGVNGTGDDTNDPNNNETEDTAYVTADADMAVSVTDSPDPVFPDGDITYTVQVSNNGPDAAPNAVLNVFNNNSLASSR